jgi:hypothetical protein
MAQNLLRSGSGLFKSRIRNWIRSKIFVWILNTDLASFCSYYFPLICLLCTAKIFFHSLLNSVPVIAQSVHNAFFYLFFSFYLFPCPLLSLISISPLSSVFYVSLYTYKQCCGAGAARSRIFWSEPEP